MRMEVSRFFRTDICSVTFFFLCAATFTQTETNDCKECYRSWPPTIELPLKSKLFFSCHSIDYTKILLFKLSYKIILRYEYNTLENDKINQQVYSLLLTASIPGLVIKLCNVSQALYQFHNFLFNKNVRYVSL